MVKLYWLRLRVASPAILTLKVGRAGFLYSTLTDYIPGSMIKGAMLSAAVNEGQMSADEAYGLAIEPDFAVSAALRSVPRGATPIAELLPTHSLCYISKLEAATAERGPRIYSLGIDKIVAKIGGGPEDAIKNALESAIQKLVSRLGWGAFPGELKEAAGKPAIRVDGEWRLLPRRMSAPEGQLSSHYIQVALDHARGGSAPGLLYAYEHVLPGVEYSCLVAASDASKMPEVLKTLGSKGASLRIGRGLTRGFGRFKMELREVEPLTFNGEGLRDGEVVALEALSPLFVLDPFPRPPRRGDFLVDPSWYRRMLSVDAGFRLEVLCVIGQPVSYRGWSLKTGLPKLPVTALDIGGIVICRVRGKAPADVLRYMPAIGLDSYASSGFNIVLPLKPDPFGGDL